MDTLLARALRPENVDRAWRYLRNDPAPWSPAVDGDALRRHLPLHLMQLAEEVAAERYRPAAVRQYGITKADGGKRVISAYYLRDKLAQRLVLQVLEPLGERLFHSDSFGYRPGRGVREALGCVRGRLATGRVWLVDADIERFLDRVPHRSLLKQVRREISDRQLCRLIARWLETGPHPGCLLEQRRGLLQGAVLSPFLCNLHLHPLDDAWARANISFVRFADDFLLLTTRRSEAEAALAFTHERLARLGLALNPRKTRICSAAEPVRFLGEPIVCSRRLRRQVAGFLALSRPGAG